MSNLEFHVILVYFYSTICNFIICAKRYKLFITG